MPSLLIRKFSISLVPAIVIFVFLAFLYPDVVFFGKTLLASQSVSGVMPSGQYDYPTDKKIEGVMSRDPGASSWQYVPLFTFSLQEYGEGRLPLWNSYMGLGAPLAAQMQSSGFFLPQLVVAGMAALKNTASHASFPWDFYFLLRLFFAGLFTYLFCRKIQLSKLASLLATMFFMGSGYFLFYANMSHINVEALLPFFLWTIESFGQEKRQKAAWWRFLFVTLASLLLVTGGFPKATFFAFLFGIFYFLVRLRTYEKPREKALWTGLAIVFGIGISAFLFFPFLEYLANSVHPHTAPFSRELTAYPWRTIITLFWPEFFGELPEAWKGGFLSAPFISLLAWPLAILALYKACRKKLTGVVNEHAGYDRRLVIFLAAISGFYILKAFGFPLVHWIENLPFLKWLNFHKYLFVEFAFAMAILAAIGFEKIAHHEKFSKFFHSLIHKLPLKKISAETLFFAAILGFLLFESASHYWFPKNVRHDPFTKAPYVEFLEREAREAGPFRIFSTDSYLMPNLSSVYGLNDIRSNDAIYPNLYYDFIKNNISPEMYDRFTGDERRLLAFDHELWNFLNVRYFITSPNPEFKLPEHFKKVYAWTDAFVFENERALDRAFLLDGKGKPLNESVRIISLQPQKITLQLDAPSSSTLLVSQLFYPGFRAAIDGGRVKILNAADLYPSLNLPVQALPIEPGKHEITIQYKAPSFKLGLLLSMLMLALTGICARFMASSKTLKNE